MINLGPSYEIGNFSWTKDEISEKLTNIGTLYDKKVGWICQDLSVSKSNPLTRLIWTVVGKRLNWIREFFYNVDLEKSKALLQDIKIQIDDNPELMGLTKIYMQAVTNFNKIAPHHKIEDDSTTPEHSSSDKSEKTKSGSNSKSSDGSNSSDVSGSKSSEYKKSDTTLSTEKNEQEKPTETPGSSIPASSNAEEDNKSSDVSGSKSSGSKESNVSSSSEEKEQSKPAQSPDSFTESLPKKYGDQTETQVESVNETSSYSEEPMKSVPDNIKTFMSTAFKYHKCTHTAEELSSHTIQTLKAKKEEVDEDYEEAIKLYATQIVNEQKVKQKI